MNQQQDQRDNHHDIVNQVIGRRRTENESRNGKRAQNRSENVTKNFAATMKKSGRIEKQERRDGNQKVNARAQPLEDLRRGNQGFQQTGLYPKSLPVQKCKQCEINRQGINLAPQESKCSRQNGD